MADLTTGELDAVAVGDLPLAPDIYDDTLIPVEQNGEAKHMTGKQWKDCAVAAAAAEADRAEVATTRVPYVGDNGNWFVWNADAEQFDDTGVKATGKGIVSIEATGSGMVLDPITGATIKTYTVYTVTYTDGDTFEFTVYNGEKGNQGDKGDPFTYEDFTEEQLSALTPTKGEDYWTEEDKAEIVSEVVDVLNPPEVYDVAPLTSDGWWDGLTETANSSTAQEASISTDPFYPRPRCRFTALNSDISSFRYAIFNMPEEVQNTDYSIAFWVYNANISAENTLRIQVYGAGTAFSTFTAAVEEGFSQVRNNTTLRCDKVLGDWAHFVIVNLDTLNEKKTTAVYIGSGAMALDGGYLLMNMPSIVAGDVQTWETYFRNKNYYIEDTEPEDTPDCAPPIVLSASGKEIVLTDSAERPLKGLTLYGKTTQDGTPTPDAPIYPASAGDSGVINVHINDQTLAVATPNGLPGIPDDTEGNYTDANGVKWVCDKIDFAKGVYVQRVNKYVIDGTESVAEYRQSYDVLIGVEMYLPSVESRYGYCSHFVTGEYNADVDNPVIAYNATTVILYSREILGYGGKTDGSGWIDYVQDQIAAGTPVTVWYILNEPIETPLSEEELAAYAALQAGNLNTNITNDAGIEMKLEYVADTTIYIERLKKEASAGIAANPLYEKKVCWRGDSIMRGYADEAGLSGWLGRIAANNNMTYENKAVSGALMTGIADSGYHSIVLNCTDFETENPDYIVLNGGTNDMFNQSLCPLGVIQDAPFAGDGATVTMAVEMESGSIDASGALESRSSCIRCVGYISVSGNKEITITNDMDYYCRLYEYDADKNFLKATVYSASPATFVTQEDTRYIMFRTDQAKVQNDLTVSFVLTYTTDSFTELFDEATYIGALESCFNKLLEAYPNAHIGFIIPYKMTVYNENAGGYVSYDKYPDAAAQVCEKWGIPCLDLRKATPLNYILASQQEFFKDFVHLNAAGYERTWRVVEAWMKTI